MPEHSSDNLETRWGPDDSERQTFPGETAPRRFSLSPKQSFGPYRIIRTLGQGGMGEVYEAEEVENGRRVALKILGRAFATRQAAERFFREGRLAAAVSHPHSVYVFDSHEIEGVPAIAMELVGGGTLQDVIERDGPMPAAKALDCVLQVVAGLEAAEAQGVLHRDVKPSNCFVDLDGVVKVGDYGLSMSRLADQTRLTLDGTFLGTPAYASPEQVRGETLDLRADIYSVGAMLHCLLTGRPPFERDGLVAMLSAVLQETPESPRTLVPAIPETLARVVLRCLEKTPGKRYETYADLRDALAPFVTARQQAASLRVRFLAYLIDMLVLMPAAVPMSLVPSPSVLGGAFRDVIGPFLVESVYFAILEGYWGASLGKRVLRLRVVGADGGTPGIPRAAVRALLLGGITATPYWLTLLPLSPFTLPLARAFLFLATFALVFSTARRSNGFRGLHELASGTRTIGRTTLRRPVEGRRSMDDVSPPLASDASHVGGFAVRARVWKSGAEALDAARDATLQRDVWIHYVPADTASPSTGRQTLARTTRLRWLGSRRSATEQWDAFEAVAGAPVRPESWARVRGWLLDLANELASALEDGTLPHGLSVDHVWIGRDGTARLTEFAARPSGLGVVHDVTDATTAQGFLQDVALASLETGAGRGRVPLSGRSVLDRLRRHDFVTLAELIDALTDAGQSEMGVSRKERAAGFAFGAILPALMVFIAVYNFPAERAIRRDAVLNRLDLMLSELRLVMADAEQTADPSMSAPQRTGYAIGRWLGSLGATPRNWSEKERRAFAIVVVDRYGSNLTDERTWAAFEADSSRRAGEFRAAVTRARETWAGATPEERTGAEQAAARILQRIEGRAASRQSHTLDWTFRLLNLLSIVLAATGVVSFVLALVLRGPAGLRLLGYAIATEIGDRVSRTRIGLRSVVAWLPVLVAGVAVLTLRQGDGMAEVSVAGPCLLIFLVGVAWAIWRPERALHDRIVRTRVVPH